MICYQKLNRVTKQELSEDNDAPRRQQSLNSSQGLSFSKVGQTSRSRSQGQKLWYHVKGLVKEYTCAI